MGLLDGFKGEVQQQFIARPDSSKDLVIYKWPETNIRMLSVLTVQPDEWAYFIKQGAVVGYLQGGQHKLDGAQIPFLGGLIDTLHRRQRADGRALLRLEPRVRQQQVRRLAWARSRTPGPARSSDAACSASTSTRSSTRRS